MKRKLLAITLVLALITTFFLPALPVVAGPPDRVPPGQLEKLDKGWRRLDSHTKVHQIGKVIHKGEEVGQYEAIISVVPTTLSDSETLIDTNWYLLSDISGQQWFQNGVNTFTARVQGGRVSVEDGNGKLSVWDSSVTVGGKRFKGGTPTIVADPLNEYYEGNTLKWEYGSYNDGFWIFGNTAQITRYLRNIQGHISELWILPINPNSNVIIKLSETTEVGTTACTEWLQVYDADGRPLKVTKTRIGMYVISAAEFSNKAFPVTIDPTHDFTTSSYDGEILGESTSYSSARTSSTGWIRSSTIGGIGQYYISGTYYIMRFMVMFDTASLPNDAIITGSYLYLYGHGDDSEEQSFYITVQSGMPTYPHMPPQSGDYYYVRYSGSGGQLYCSGDFSTSGYNVLYLNDTGMGWISLDSWTKFMLRSSRDIAGNAPTAWEYVTVREYSYGLSYAPELRVIYSEPVSPPVVTTQEASSVTSISAKLEGYLADDGSEACSVRFQYGTSTSYGSDTAWESGMTTGTYFSKTVYGLSPGTTYHFRAQAMNSAGTSSGVDRELITPPYVPTNFTATAGDNTVSLTWTKGTGADKTMIRRSTSDYPSTPSDGTQIYFDTGASHNDNTVTNDTTYYYSAWSEKLGVYSTTKVTDSATPSGPTTPTVTTNDATAVTTTTATLHLYLNDLGGYATTDVWFQYHADGGNWGDNETTPTEKSIPGSHSAGIATLNPSTLYHVRAAAQNTAGTVYGSDVPFTTGDISAPTMTTQNATGLQLKGATLNGVVTADGGATVTAWFEWGLTTSYGTSTPSISGLSTSDTFYYGLTSLEPSTTYHYRAIGQNSAGIGYGSDLEFVTTSPPTPTIRTDTATNVGANQAQLNATLLTDGGVTCEVRFQYGLTDSYGDNTTWVEGYTKDQTIDKLVAGLAINETYHFRAQAKNEGGTGSGNDATFTTVFDIPQNFRAKAISSTTINFEWQKSGDQTHIRYKQSGFPIDRADGYAVYLGPDEFTSVSGLTAGTTYYFRAWSWREGDVWAEGYAEDVATTHASVTAGEEPAVPDTLTVPEEPETWSQEPSGALLTQLPFYQAGVDFADSYELPHGTFWFLVAMVIVIVAGLVTGIVSGGHVIPTVIVGGFALMGCVALGMVSGWFILAYVILSGGAMYLMKGGSV